MQVLQQRRNLLRVSRIDFKAFALEFHFSSRSSRDVPGCDCARPLDQVRDVAEQKRPKQTASSVDGGDGERPLLMGTELRFLYAFNSCWYSSLNGLASSEACISSSSNSWLLLMAFRTRIGHCERS